MDGLTNFQILIVIFLCTTNVFSYYEGSVTLSHNGPVVLGANITFSAEVFSLLGEHPSGKFGYQWQDSANPQHSLSVTGVTNTSMNWTISFPANTYTAQEYNANVLVSKKAFFYLPYAHESIMFNITDTLNGRIESTQEGVDNANEFVSIASPVKHTIHLSEPDHNFLKNNATSILTFWFIDCTYYGFTTDFSFTFNYTEEKSYSIDALVVASFDEPATTSTTTTTAPTTTTATTTSSTPTTQRLSSSTSALTAASVTEKATTIIASSSLPASTKSFLPEFSGSMTPTTKATTLKSKNTSDSNLEDLLVGRENYSFSTLPTPSSTVDKTVDASDLSEMLASGAIHLKRRRASRNDNYVHNDIFDNILSYGCLNSTFIPPSRNKTYGYFRKEIKARVPISKVLVKGNNWLKFGDVLSLNITCNGSPRFKHCSKIKVGVYNITGEESCSAPLEGDECNFTLPHYFREANVYTYIIIVMNDVSKIVTPAVIRMYKESVQPQLSVIVVPVSCSLVAIIIIVFGIAYYVQSQNRYSIEVADFDFGQANDMEYKSFYERLREDLSNMFSRSSDFIDHNDAVPQRSKYDNMEES